MSLDEFSSRLRNLRKVTGCSYLRRRTVNTLKAEDLDLASEILSYGISCLVDISRVSGPYGCKERRIVKDLTGVIPCLESAERVRTHDPEEFMLLFRDMSLKKAP